MTTNDYICILACLSKFTNPKSLANHQRKCRVYLQYEESLWQSAVLQRKHSDPDSEHEIPSPLAKRRRTNEPEEELVREVCHYSTVFQVNPSSTSLTYMDRIPPW